ncbi:hypothetical protein OAO87_03715 [bacterium]|nr:hypothetical protein [bacterium]
MATALGDCTALLTAALPPTPRVRSSHGQLVIDGRTHRVFAATVQREDGSVHECCTKPVLHEVRLPNETSADRLRREDREHKRISAALRQLDPDALASARAKDRERKRAKCKPVRRTDALAALPNAWLLPPAEQPHFVGEHVWHFPAAGGAPTHGIIQQLTCDGSARAAVGFEPTRGAARSTDGCCSAVAQAAAHPRPCGFDSRHCRAYRCN